MQGTIHSIESFATHDGDGVRAAVFLQGCPLRCVYCHNPDTWSLTGGETVSADALATRLLRFRPYFGCDGGVTFSGGEPLLQAEFLLEVTSLLHQHGVHVALDTALSVSTKHGDALLAAVDQVIADLKFYTRDDTLTYTSADVLETVLQNFQYLNDIQKPTRVRTVICPNINDTLADVLSYLDVLKPFSNIVGYELVPFHTMGFHKYESMGIRNPMQGVSALSNQKLSDLQNLLPRRFRK